MAKSKRRGGKGFKGSIATLTILLIVAGAILSVIKTNGISSVADFLNYARSKSHQYQEKCLDSHGLPTRCGLNAPAPKKPSEVSLPKVTVPDPQLPYERPQPASSASLEALNSLNVAERDDSAYSRKDWKHWIGSPCNTRETALKDYGKDVVADPKTCKIKSGTWVDAYSGETITDPKMIDVDHIIPLKAANMLGGSSWSPELKQQYANDPDVLIPVSARENRSKSDKGPSDYMPPNKAYQCEYAKRWVNVSVKYNLSVTPADKKVLTSALQGCKG